MTLANVGRPRDLGIDRAVLTAAREQLAMVGYEAMSLSAVAERAGTSRQALYRRWATKADLATAAIATMSRAAERVPTDDPFAELVEELQAFQIGVTRPNGVSMVGTMLQESVDPGLRRHYRERLVEPRRERIRAILGRAIAAGLVDGDVDLDYAAAACTGSLYGLALAGHAIESDWATKTASLVWRGLGGQR